MIARALQTVVSFYRPYYVVALSRILKSQGYNASAFISRYLRMGTFAFPGKQPTLNPVDKLLVALLAFVALGQLAVGGMLVGLSASGSMPEAWLYGTAIVLAVPLVLAAITPIMFVAATILAALSPKRLGYNVLSGIFEWQVKRLRERNDFRIVGVVGSVGKTSTKISIAHTLKAAGLRVRHQEGNYNVRLTVPLVLFGRSLPHLFNAAAWLAIFLKNEHTLRKPYPYDVVVLELGTDGPGQIAQFGYLQPDLVVVTAVAPEHMEYFGTLDAVAAEELSAAQYAKGLLINTDDVAEKYREGLRYVPYGLAEEQNGYTAESTGTDASGQEVLIFKYGEKLAEGRVAFLGPQGRKIILAAAAVGDMLGVDADAIARGMTKLEPVSGRLRKLKGVKDTLLLDDTYNAAPASVEAALQVLSSIDAPQRIAILGSMNELGDFSPEAHKAVGASINPDRIDLVVTIGVLAHDYLAPSATAAGCRVVSFMNPHEAGEFVKSEIKQGAAILAKGSQNGVFAEEALKVLLADKKDAASLVRQSKYWMRIKRKQFKLPK